MSKQPFKKLIEIKRRKVSAINTYSKDIKEFEEILNSSVNPPTPLLSYTPIFLVTNIEIVTKELISILIDSGEPYITKSYELLDSKTFSIDGLKLLQREGADITFGFIISSLMSISEFNVIEKDLSKLIGIKLKKALSNELGKGTEPIITNIDDTFKCLHHLFEIRHQLVHENSSLKITLHETNLYLCESKRFLDALVSYIMSLIESPSFQAGMNSFYAKKNFDVEQQIEELINQIKLNLQNKDEDINTIRARISKLEKAYNTWKKFVNEISEFECYSHLGGSIYNTFFSLCKNSFNQFLLYEFERKYSKDEIEKENF